VDSIGRRDESIKDLSYAGGDSLEKRKLTGGE